MNNPRQVSVSGYYYDPRMGSYNSFRPVPLRYWLRPRGIGHLLGRRYPFLKKPEQS